MNLLPVTEKDILKRGLRLRLFIVANTLFAISFLLSLVMFLPAFFLTSEHLSVAKLSISSPKTTDEDTNQDILKLPGEINSKLTFFQVNIGNNGATAILTKIVSKLSDKVKLNSILFTKNQGEKGKKGISISVSGIALSRDALVSFGTALKESKSFTSVDVPVSSLTKDKDLPFTMSIFVEI